MRQLTTIGNLRSLRALDRQTRLAPLRIGYMGDMRLDAAIAMNDALAAHGYNVGDQGLYRAYESAAGLKPDGYPGQGTITKLFADLAAAGIAHAAVAVYPWKKGAYDGVNAPPSSEWYAAPPAEGPGFVAMPETPAPATPSSPSALPALPAPLPPFTPAPSPSTPAAPGTHPIVVAHSYDNPWVWGIGLAVAGGVAYGLTKWAKKRRHGRRHTATTRRIAIFA